VLIGSLIASFLHVSILNRARMPLTQLCAWFQPMSNRWPRARLALPLCPDAKWGQLTFHALSEVNHAGPRPEAF
jgi:hypothetical protein